MPHGATGDGEAGRRTERIRMKCIRIGGVLLSGRLDYVIMDCMGLHM